MKIAAAIFMSIAIHTGLSQSVEPRDINTKDKKSEVIAFLKTRTLSLPQKIKCFNYETLTNWTDGQKNMQRWKKVHWTLDGYCKYLGLTSNPKLQIPDPKVWQLDTTVLIEDRNFYDVSLFNNQYTAKYVNEGRFTEGAGKQLANVAPADSLRKPLLLEMMLGEFFTRRPIVEFIENAGSRVIQFSNENRQGRSVKRLVMDGHVSREKNPQAIYMNRFTWDFDAETGYCLISTGENTQNNTAGGFCTIKYVKPKGDIWCPDKTVSKTNSFLDTQTTYVRNCNTDCLEDSNEHLLSYHGFKEPVFDAEKVVSMSNLGWKLWLNIGVVLLLIALVMHFRRRHQLRSVGSQIPHR